MIFGIGTDIVQITRVEKIYKKFGYKFLQKNYHMLEIIEFEKISNTQKQIAFLAKRFAAKEAIVKALGIGIGMIAFKEISITNDKKGAPLAEIFSKTPIYKNYLFHVSLSDDYPIAIAYVVVSMLMPHFCK